MFLDEGHIQAFRRVVENPNYYDIQIRPLIDCVSYTEKWTDMSGIIAHIYQEYRQAIPLDALTAIFLDKFGDLSVKDHRGDIVCKLKYNKYFNRRGF